MSDFQRVIKYFATAFAILLAVGIISGIASIAVGVASFVSDGTQITENSKRIDFDQSFSDVRNLNIKHSVGELFIEAGEEFRVVAENVSADFDAKVTSNGTLTVEDKNNFNFVFWFSPRNNNFGRSRITITVPSDFILKNTKINSGAGKVSIESLKTERLDFNTGAGSIEGNNIKADRVKIDAGVGSMTLRNVIFTDADINSGVGSMNISGEFYGKNTVNCGVGEVRIDIVGNIKDYNYNVKAGVGKAYLNGDKVTKARSSSSRLDHSISVDGGVGSVRIDFTQ